jgi:hypothetical protein
MNVVLGGSFASLFALALAGCAHPPPERVLSEGRDGRSEPAEHAPVSAKASPSPGIEAKNEPSQVVPASAVKTRDVPMPFLEWVASHCHIDALGPSAYTAAWFRHARLRTSFEEDALWPVPNGFEPLPEGSPEAAELAAVLRERFRMDPKSHVVDCRFEVPLRSCEHCKGKGDAFGHYIAYLPAALFSEPERVRSILLLVPGGRGGRSRAFLSPIPEKTIYDQGWGGLRTRQLVDAYLERRPGAAAPIVVSLESAGAEINNGRIEHLTHDVPRHIAETYLGGAPLSEIAIGAQGISSGGRAITEALFKKPDSFDAVALTCMACGVLDTRRPFAFPALEADAWARALKARAERGLFSMRFTIGSRDGQKPCSDGLYAFLGERGLFDLSSPPVYSNCAEGAAPGEESCDVDRPSWRSYAGEMHHYGLLQKSFTPELEWILGELDQIDKTRERAREREPSGRSGVGDLRSSP